MRIVQNCAHVTSRAYSEKTGQDLPSPRCRGPHSASPRTGSSPLLPGGSSASHSLPRSPGAGQLAFSATAIHTKPWNPDLPSSLLAHADHLLTQVLMWPAVQPRRTVNHRLCLLSLILGLQVTPPRAYFLSQTVSHCGIHPELRHLPGGDNARHCLAQHWHITVPSVTVTAPLFCSLNLHVSCLIIVCAFSLCVCLSLSLHQVY